MAIFSMNFVLILLASFFISSQGMDMKNCDAKAPIQFSVTQFPSKLPLKNNATFHVSAGIQIKNYVLPKKIKIKVDVSKHMLFWVKLPCIGCDQLLSCDKLPQLCMVKDFCTDCSLNVKNVKIRMPGDIEQKIPGFVPNFAIDGKYWLKLRVVNADNEKETIACAEIITKLDA
eukprot:TCONS_00010776-protein